jgi:hypothetical protein
MASILIALLLSILANRSAPAADSYYLIDNFSSPLPDEPGLAFSVVTVNPKVGLGALKVDYVLPGDRRPIDFTLPEKRWMIPAAGNIVFWLKGDQSDTELQFTMITGQFRTEPDGRRSLINAKSVELHPVKADPAAKGNSVRLDSTEWREITLDASEPLPADYFRWIARIRVAMGPESAAHAALHAKSGRAGHALVHARFQPDGAPREHVAQAPLPVGTFMLDDMRLYPAAGSDLPKAAVSATLLGPAVRDFTNDFPVALDVRNFTATAAKVKVRLSMSDRNLVPVVDRDFDLALAAEQSKEFKLDLAPENIGSYLPPFHVSGDVISTDLPPLAAKIDVNVVMSNCRILYDNLSDVNGRWVTRGYAAPPGSRSPSIGEDLRNWNVWSMGEPYRAVPWTQTSIKLTRVAIDRPAGVDAKKLPPDGFAMKFEYKGDAVAYTGFEKFIPGRAFRFGIWVKGDGSNNRLLANFLDFSDLSDFYFGAWKRTTEGIREVCRLNFTDWRYFEMTLPGNGIGVESTRGSTDEIDFPIELNALLVLPDQPSGRPDPTRAPAPQSGTILIGPMFADTQVAAAKTLAVMVGYDDPYLDYAPRHGATVSVQNAWRTGSRKIAVEWKLLDKDNKPFEPAIAGKQDELTIPAGEIKSFRIELAAYAAKIASAAGPLRLVVDAFDKEDAGIRVQREIDLAKPDSIIHLADFESDRGYLGTRAEGITNAPPKGEAAARTTTTQHHSGKRSLEIRWDKEKNATRFVAIDPPIPGVSIDVSLWVKGDGSGALFYPVIGGPTGVRAGLGTRNWNLFIPRVVGGELQDAVRLDFTDWRQFTFHFIPIADNFDKPLPVLHFRQAYPQGLHLGVDAREATGESGAVYVDDVTVRTHLEPANRLAFAIRRDSDSNVILPNTPITFIASNYDAAALRHVTVRGGVFNWRGECVAPVDTAINLLPGSSQDIVLKQQLLPGAYELRAEMKDGTRVVGTVAQDLLVADMDKLLGADWESALKDEWRLRVPIRDDYTYIDEDWDWVEFHPGNLQTDSMRNRFMRAKDNGAKPWMLLGFSAVWAASTKFEQMQAGALDRGYRDSGHGVDIFHVPEREADWEDYILEVMRGVGTDVSGWVLWDNPDGASTVAMPPKRLAKLIRISDKWRRIYCPKTPLIIGGMSRATAVPYLAELANDRDEKSEVETDNALSHISGVNVKMDVGRMSPEDAQVLPYAQILRQTLAMGGKDPKQIILSELDWAVEKSADGLNVFDQAAYLTRSDLLLSRAGIKPPLNIVNEDRDRIGTGLAYRMELYIPPMTEKTVTYNLKPAWWAMVRLRELLSKVESVDQIPVEDTTPQRTQAMLFRQKADGKAVVVVWRNDDPGAASFAHTVLSVQSAEDVFGAVAPAKEGWYAIGKVPVVFTLGASAAEAQAALSRLWIRDGAEPAWSQRVIAQFTPEKGQAFAYEQKGGAPAALNGRTPTGEVEQLHGLAFASGGTEKFTIPISADAGLVLRKRYRIDKVGQSAKVIVNGNPAGTWDLKRKPVDDPLSEGIRDAIYFIDAAALKGASQAKIEIVHDGPANTIAWTAFEYRGGDFPLTALGPILADQQVAPIRLGRNMIGGQLKVDTETYPNGIGAFANSILEYPLNRQFKRFTAKVGIDAATEGRGSVIFEVVLDGKRPPVWTSGIMSGLDRPKKIDIDVTNVNRLRLIVNDAGDGNKFDAGDWCEPVLKR